MKVRIIMKSGVHFDVKCKRFECKCDENTGEITQYEFVKVNQNRNTPAYITPMEIVAVIRIRK